MPLSYEAEAWLVARNPSAWGYLKAMQYESDPEQIARIKAILPENVKKDIADAYRRRHAATRPARRMG